MGNKTHKINTTSVVSDSAKLLNFLYWNKNLSNLNYFFLLLPQYSIRLVTFDFQSFIGLEKRLRILKKNRKVFKKFYKFHSFATPNFFQKFYKFHHSHNTKFTKKYKSLPTTRNKIFAKFYKFLTRAPKKGHASIVTGGHAPPRYKAGIFTTTNTDFKRWIF